MPGLFSDAVQREIISEIETHTVTQWSDIFNDVISWHIQKRGIIQNGLYRRQQLEKASKYQWDTPREADGVPIYAREATSEADINLRIHKPYDKLIITNKASYMGAGITTEIPDNTQLADQYESFEELNQWETLAERLVRDAAGLGAGFGLLWNDGSAARMRKVNPWESLVVYDENTQIPVYGFRYWTVVELINGQEETTKVRLDFYDGTTVYHFISEGTTISGYNKLGTAGAGTFSPYVMDGETSRVHTFGTVEDPGIPLIEFPNSEGRLGDVELSIDMQDAYDIGVSDISSELSQLAHAYLVQEPVAESGVVEYHDVDEKFVEQLKSTGVMLGKWRFLTKDINAEAEDSNLVRLRHDIFQSSMSYDPDEIAGDQGDMTAFQIERKLTGLEQAATDTETEFKQAFNRMDARLRVYFTEFDNLASYELTEISRKFPRNVPTNELQDLKDANEANVKLSQREKLSRAFPDVDYEENQKQIRKEADEAADFLTSEEIEPDGLTV